MKILFVCLGNICRSPAAEGIMDKLIKERGLRGKVTCDSAGTSAHHQGEPADQRMSLFSQQRGYMLTSVSRKFEMKDFEEFDYILAMDKTNLVQLKMLDKKDRYGDKVFRMTSFCRNHQVDEVPDPYYGGSEGFETVLDILEDACEGLMQKIEKEFE